MKRLSVLLVVLFLVGCTTPPTSTPSPLVTPTPNTSPLTPQAEDAGALVVVGKSTEETEETNTMDYAIGGIGVAALILGITEALKEFGVSGKASRAVVLILGFFFVGLSVAVTQGMIPADAVVYVELVVTALAGGLSAMGYYDFIRKLVAK